jgi:hypothetical protein
VNAGNVIATQPPVLIQTRVNDYVAVMPRPGVILFTVNASSPQDGLYLHAITPPTPGNPDAATDSGDGGQPNDHGASVLDAALSH